MDKNERVKEPPSRGRQSRVGSPDPHNRQPASNAAEKLLIAVVDDDPLYLKFIGHALEAHNMRCIVATHSSALVRQINTDTQPDVFLLDYHLGTSRETGLSLCRSMRLRYDRPVIMLTGDSQTQTIVNCLEAGAEQYLIKPCSVDELAARIRVVLRDRQSAARSSNSGSIALRATSSQALTLGDITLKIGARVLQNAQDEARFCSLTEKESQLLQLFMQSPDQQMSRADAFYRLYSYEMQPENRSVDVLVTKLRKKITKVDSVARIQTLRGKGYQLIVVANEDKDDAFTVSMTDGNLINGDLLPALDRDQLALTLDSTEPSLQIEFYDIFLQHVKVEMDKLAHAQINPDAVRAIAHQLKSSSQSIGTPRFTRALLDIEKAALSTDTNVANLQTALQTIGRVWQETAQAIAHRMAELSS